MGGRPDNSVSCREAQLLTSSFIQHDPDLAPDQRDAVEAHLSACPACAEEYEQDRRLVALLRRHWPISEDTQQLLGQASHELQEGYTCTKRWRPMTVAEGWEDLKRRCPSLARACRPDERTRKLHKIA
jgi:predicted anti-sigma-YlaC factor YlaD